MKKQLSHISLRFKHNCYQSIPNHYNRVFLLLHGYLLDGEFMFNKLKDILPADSAIIAPDAPFPVPVKKHHEFRIKYGWYFFDPNKKLYYLNMESAVDYLKQVLDSLVTKDTPITVIGYSQGGYLAPKLAEHIPQIDTVIGMACKFRNEIFKYRSDVAYYQINGSADLVVDYPEAKKEFELLSNKGNRGEFITLEDIGHRLDDNYLQSLRSVLS